MSANLTCMGLTAGVAALDVGLTAGGGGGGGFLSLSAIVIGLASCW